MEPHNLTLEGLAQAYQSLQEQFVNAQNQIADLRNDLSTAQGAVIAAQSTQLASGPRPKRPDSFRGRGSIGSWILHMNNYVLNQPEPLALSIAVSYLDGPAHEWWIAYKESEEGKHVATWSALRHALRQRFETLNKVKIGRHKLAKWKQVKDVSLFNDDFQRIVLDILWKGFCRKVILRVSSTRV